MADKQSTIANALFTKTQLQILRLLYGQVDRSFYTQEIVRLAGVGIGSVQRELTRLAEAGLLSVSRLGNQKHYQANAFCPVYHELHGIVLKTFGLVNTLQTALEPMNEKIRLAFVFSSIDSGKKTSGSDVDLLIIGDAGYQEIVKALYSAQETLGREINPKIFSEQEWVKMMKSKDAFIKEVLAKPKLFVVGSSDELG